jgi:hypothetical protein
MDDEVALAKGQRVRLTCSEVSFVIKALSHVPSTVTCLYIQSFRYSKTKYEPLIAHTHITCDVLIDKANASSAIEGR